jgi:phospholipase C
MSRSTVLLFLALLIFGAGVLVSRGSGEEGFVAAPVGSSKKIQHVVIIFQENRTTDNLFHGLRNADIADSGVDSAGQRIPLTPVSLVTNYDLGHTHGDFELMYDGGKMDGADKIPVLCSENPCPLLPQFSYVDPAEVVPYFQLAEKYTFADQMFQTNQGPSFPAHQFIISGTSAPTATSNLFAAENPSITPGPNHDAGCTAPVGSLVLLIDPTGEESSRIYPCFEHQTLADLLDAKGIDWKYYAPTSGSIWTGPNAIKHLREGPDWATHMVFPEKLVLSDIAAGHLAPVTWVIPDGRSSDHAGKSDGTGPSWVASVVNAIGNSAFWPNTAIFITWDDWGGWYDHVPPPMILNSYEYGFRVPLIVVSPYARPGHVSHATHDFGSILKFIELNFGLPSLGYADARANNLLDCFNLSQTPLPFEPIAAPFDANYFLSDHRSPTDPDDD